MSILLNTHFQIGIILLFIGLVITIFSNVDEYKNRRFVVNIFQGMGLGYSCIAIFDASQIFVVVIFLLWMIPYRLTLRARDVVA